MTAGQARTEVVALVYVSDPATPQVEENDAHHLRTVLRLRDGESIISSDGKGSWTRCRFVDGGRGSDLTLEVTGPLMYEPCAAPSLGVGFVPVKGTRPEWVVQKLTELGVDRITVLRSRRAVVRVEGARATSALERLARVAREAGSQSGRVWLPEISYGVELGTFLARDGAVVAAPGGGPLEANAVSIAVGPEGGWTPDELPPGTPTVGLGPQVLRAETAAIVAGTLVTAVRAGIVALDGNKRSMNEAGSGSRDTVKD
jgi:16S rRNA (uracil1498-N3)-methyltransferase